MNTEGFNALAQFCAEQYYAFDSEAWLRNDGYDRNAATVAAMYLSLTSWYGHEDDLVRIAFNTRSAHASGEDFQRAAQSIGFDLAQFSAMVRCRIAEKRGKTHDA